MTMTINGVSTTKANGQEQYEKCKIGKKVCVQYDYRHSNGNLFSCVKPTLEICRQKRDEWLKWQVCE